MLPLKKHMTAIMLHADKDQLDFFVTKFIHSDERCQQ